MRRLSSCDSDGVRVALLRGLNLVLDPGQVDVVGDFVAVDHRHRRRRGHRRSAHEARRFVQEEATDEKQGDEHPDVFRQAAHLLQHGLKLRSAGGWEKNREIRSSEACNVRCQRGLKSSEDVTSD